MKITHNPHINISNYWIDSKDVFPTVEIPGGIAATFWNNNKDLGIIGTFSAYPELTSIANKVNAITKQFISSIVSPREYFGITDILYEENPEMEGRQSKGHKYSLGANIFDVFPELFFDVDNNIVSPDMALVFGRVNNQRGYKCIKSAYITHPDNFFGYKVIISKADGAAGQIGKPIPARIMGKADIGKPNEAYTDTFIAIGNFTTYDEASACQRYVQTKFARVLLGLLKVTQMNTRDTWANVPMQDFTVDSDIDWSKSIEEIDAQLYAKYNLTDEEIAFIESMIKPM